MNIDHWIKIHEQNFGSPFEKEFAIKVLGKINDIDLSIVSTQYHFKDLDGKDRYCDFVIQEGLMKIAIEIDGYDKRNTGHGMSHDDFVDWQRRQTALTASGWHVLRFANRDVINVPSRCRRYIELLLRDQRSKSQHQVNLKETISLLNNQLRVAQSKSVSTEQTNKLKREINQLKRQLSFAQNTKPLGDKDRHELGRLVVRLEQENEELISAHHKIKEEKDQLAASNTSLKVEQRFLDGENRTMKTTIWAFAVIIGILIVAGAYVFTKNSAVQTATPISNAPVYAAAVSCESPIDWRLAKNYVNQLVAVRGTVKECRYTPNVKGAPTWINLGAKYPVKDRLTVVIWGDDRDKFGRALSEESMIDRQICVIGKVKLRDGTPQITVKWPRELVFQ